MSLTFNKGDYARVYTWYDDDLSCKSMGVPDAYRQNAQLEDYLILANGEPFGSVVLLISYKCSWSYPIMAIHSTKLGIDPQYQGQRMYFCPISWVLEVHVPEAPTSILRSRNEPDGAQCQHCKYFVHMAAPNGAELGLPSTFFICRTCRHNDSLLFLLKEKFPTPVVEGES